MIEPWPGPVELADRQISSYDISGIEDIIGYKGGPDRRARTWRTIMPSAINPLTIVCAFESIILCLYFAGRRHNINQCHSSGGNLSNLR
jgi:hypothetical protein